jgi:hypothetical protein
MMIDSLGPQHSVACRDRKWSRGLEGIYGRPGPSIRDRLARPACVGAGSLACRLGGARMGLAIRTGQHPRQACRSPRCLDGRAGVACLGDSPSPHAVRRHRCVSRPTPLREREKDIVKVCREGL